MWQMSDVLDTLRAVTTAVQCRDLPSVESYLQERGDPNACYGLTLLALAVDAGSIEIVKMLLDAGANPNFSGKSGKFPLYLAARNQHPGNLDVLRLLIDSGADVNMKYLNGNTALLESVWMNDVDKAAMLLAAGADILDSNNGGDTSLHISSQKGNVDMTRLLIKAGAPVNRVKFRGRCDPPPNGIRPLHLTSFGPSGGFSEVARLLLQSGAEVNAAEANGRTTLHHTAIRNAYRVVDVLLEYDCDVDPISMENNEHKTPLMKAIDGGHPTVVNRLLDAGADLNTVDVWGATPLIAAVYSGIPDVVKSLIQHGCDVDQSLSGEATHLPLRVSLRHPPHITLSIVLAGGRVAQDVVEHFRALAQSDSEHAPVFAWMLHCATQPESLRNLCRRVMRVRLGPFRRRTFDPDTGRTVVEDKLEALIREGFPRRICDIITCRELNDILANFPELL